MESNYAPVHSLVFFCDPLLYNWRKRGRQEHGVGDLELGKGDLQAQCGTAFSQVAKDGMHRTNVVADFLNFSVPGSGDFLSQKNFLNGLF